MGSPSLVAGLKSRPVKRGIIFGLAFFFAAAFTLVLVRLQSGSFLPQKWGLDALTRAEPGQPSCSSVNNTGSRELVRAAHRKFRDLPDAKFTIAIQTYKRPKELAETLKMLTDDLIPSLLEIVVIWNDLDDKPPKNYRSRHGVPIRYRASKRNSLNEKLLPDPEFKTQAILLSDDDVYYHPRDLEFAFQTWRKFGKDRLTGAMARCTYMNDKGEYDYSFCNRPKGDNTYTLIITNLSFAHIRFLDYYSSDDPTMVRIREYVDEHFNCEDIAMNYVTSLLTGTGPLLVRGKEAFVNYEPREGISRKKGHIEARTQCLNDFAEEFGCMPLVDETAHIEIGVKHS